MRIISDAVRMTRVEVEPVDRLQENVSAEYFFSTYYVQRKPVILTKVSLSRIDGSYCTKVTEM